jgi:hypothetical protein
MLIYHMCFNRHEATVWLTYVLTGLAVLAASALSSRFIQIRWMERWQFSAARQSWPATIGCLILGGSVVLAELMLTSKYL